LAIGLDKLFFLGLKYYFMQLIVLLQALVTFFIVFDPIGSLPIFIDLTKKFNDTEKRNAVNKAVAVAGVLAFIFIFLGKDVLDFMGISFNSFKIAGGAVLFLLGLEMILGFKIHKRKVSDYSVAVSIISVPLITGPGVITMSIFLASSIGILMTSISAFLSILIIWIIFKHAEKIQGELGEANLRIVSKVMGLIIASEGINLIISVLGL
jgi:multiple antibiotic resistance protein